MVNEYFVCQVDSTSIDFEKPLYTISGCNARVALQRACLRSSDPKSETLLPVSREYLVGRGNPGGGRGIAMAPPRKKTSSKKGKSPSGPGAAFPWGVARAGGSSSY